MLGIDKGGHAARLLRLRDDLQRDSGFARGFRAEDFNHSPARETAHPQSGVEGNRARRDYSDGDNGFLRAQPHNGALTKLFFNLRECQIYCFGPFICHENAAPL